MQGQGGEGATEPVADADVRRDGLHVVQRPRHGLEHSRSFQGKLRLPSQWIRLTMEIPFCHPVFN